MKTYQNPITEILLLAGERMMDEAHFSYGGGGHGEALLQDKSYAPQVPQVPQVPQAQ